MTLIEKDSEEDPEFDIEREGETSDPPFASLDRQYLTYRPLDPLLEGRTFAVYITGHVNVNDTIQGSVYAHNEYVEVTILKEVEGLENSAPYVQNPVKKLEVYSGDKKVYSVGSPIDM